MADVEEGDNPVGGLGGVRPQGKPHGASLISVLFAGIAFACSTVATYSCNYVEITERDDSNNVLGTYSRGIWYGQDDLADTCSKYGSSSSGSPSVGSDVRAARAFGVLTTLFGGFAMVVVLMLYAAPSRFIRMAMVSMGGLCLKCCLFQGLTLLMIESSFCKGDYLVKNSKSKCDMDLGAQLTICAIIFWLVAACTMMPNPAEKQMMKEARGRMLHGGEEPHEQASAEEN
jgi:hypothetical protein